MKNSYFINIRLPILTMLAGTMLGFVTHSHAQSVQEWSEPINISRSGGTTNPSMVVDGDGSIHVIWLDQFDGFKYAQSTDGVTWTSPETVNFPFSEEAPPPVMFSDAAGIIHIFWLSEQNQLSYGQSLPENLASPLAWRGKSNLDSSVFDFDAAVDAQGQVHVTYIKNPALDPGAAGVFYQRSTDGGRTWRDPALLYESPYFRTIDAETAHIRMAVSDRPEENRVYVVWDDRTQKRIFISISADGGLTWGAIKELVVPQENLGYKTPYNADIDVLDNKVLATWFVGDAEVRCTPYSWSSSDGGETWGEQVPILSELPQCPEKSEFLAVDPEYSVTLFTIQGNLSLSAWNGSDWSNPDVQIGPSSITNPATFEPVLLACEQVAAYSGRLFVAGCDEGSGGDIWFLERQLNSLDDLFPLPSEWSGDAIVTTTPRMFSSLSSIADDGGNIHAIWVQSPFGASDAFAPVIEYARGDGTEWTRPSPIITNTGGLPIGLSLQIDSQQRLLLTWVNQNTGELLFSWSNSEQANIPLEWSQPVILSADSKLTNSPDMLVDAADRIVIAYAVTLNEERGIYVTQSTDLGETWSPPVKVFDAISEGWEMVDQPKLGLTAEGSLHLLFTKYELVGEPQAVGLYYSQSKDGGVTWSTAAAVSEHPVQWSELVADQDGLHRLWQETNKSAAQTSHQISRDGGNTWMPSIKIPTDSEIDSEPSVSIDGDGILHYIQVTGLDSQVFEEWIFEEEGWQTVENRKVTALELNSPPIVESGITSAGRLYVLLDLEKLLEDAIESDILSISRSLEMTEPAPPPLAVISTPSTSSTPMPTADPQLLATPTSPLAELNDPQPRVNRNIVGLILVTVIVLLIIVFMVPRRSDAHDKTRK